jgi:hypothetical protein
MESSSKVHAETNWIISLRSLFKILGRQEYHRTIEIICFKNSMDTNKATLFKNLAEDTGMQIFSFQFLSTATVLIC